MQTEIIESKEIYRGFTALRLATLRLGRCTGEPRDHRARQGRGGSSQ
jgi:hypothetical protein